MDRKTTLFNSIRKHIKNIDVYNNLTTSYLNDDYTVFLEKIYQEQSKITVDLTLQIEILSKEINIIINKMNYIASDIKTDISELLNKNELLMKELDYYKRRCIDQRL
jgi:hypothetical protein